MKAAAKRRPAEILLVEDDDGDVLLIREAFKAAGFAHRIGVALDGEEALDYLRGRGRFSGASRPDLILLDLNLPRMNGREALAEIKKDPELRRIPVIILTTSDAEHDVFQAYDLHANCFITKPLGLAEFSTIARRICEFWLETARLPAGAARVSD